MRRLLPLVVSCLLAGIVGLTTLTCAVSSPQRLQPTPAPTGYTLASRHASAAAYAPSNRNSADRERSYTHRLRDSEHAIRFVLTLSAKLVAHSTVIVIGTIPNDKPDEVRAQDKISADVQAVGGGYHVQVERYLKGTGGDTIPVVQFYGLDFTDRGQRRQMRDNNTNLLLGKGNRYLLFLKENGSIPGYWSGTIHPYKFLLKDGLAKAESPVGDLDGAFPEQSEADFISSIESRIAESP